MIASTYIPPRAYAEGTVRGKGVVGFVSFLLVCFLELALPCVAFPAPFNSKHMSYLANRGGSSGLFAFISISLV